MLGQVRQSTKAALLAFAVQTGLLVIQLALLDDRAPLWVLVLPIAVNTSMVWLYTEQVMRYRMRGLGMAFTRMAAGDLDTQLPPAPDADAEPIRMAFVRLGDSLRTLTATLRATDASRRQLFADLAHELGTPTGTVVALADALTLPSVEASAERRNAIAEALVGEGARLSRLVRDLRDLAELDDPALVLESEPSDVVVASRAVVQRLALARNSVAAAVSGPERLVLSVDVARLEQVLTNLLANAYRHTPADGTIEVRWAVEPGAAVLSVVDSGAGVDESMMGKLGERLFRADLSRSRASGGSGIGLPIVRAIVERHGGTLGFSRSPLGGLRVEVRLPHDAGLTEA
jgi:signal transduction histidine kinase